MLIASMVVKTRPDAAQDVMLSLGKLPGVTTHGVHGESNIILLAEAETEEDMESLTKYIMNEFKGVLGIFPTYLSSDQLPLNTTGAN
jgi:nitrate reductase NapAB chaperone NapD